MSAAELLILTLLLPAMGAVGIALVGRRPNLRETVTLVTSIALFAIVLSLLERVFAGEKVATARFEILPDVVDLGLAVEPLGMLFACVASGLWIVNSIYSIGYMRGNNEPRQTSYYVSFAIAIASAMGIAFAANLFTLFLFYEILTLSTYPLVTHKGDEKARAGGRVYLLLLLGTSMVLLLPAIIWTGVLAGTVDFAPGGILNGKVSGLALGGLLVLYLFGIGKAALMPFHFWLPAAMVAPTPVSALLHAVAVVKAGVFTVMKVAVYVFGLDLLNQTPVTQWMLYAAAFTVLAASLIAMVQDNLKRRLAYSTVSQLSYVVIGALLATRLGVVGGTMHIAMHAFGKITLFFCAGAIYTAAHKTEISELRGLGRAMPITFICFLIGALSIIGLPPMGGVWSKWYLALGALEAHEIAIVAVLMISSLLNIAYLLPIPLMAFFANPASGRKPAAMREAPWPCLLAIVICAVGTIALFLFPGALYDLAQMMFANRG